MKARQTYDYQFRQVQTVMWKDGNPFCPNCLGARHVVMTRPGDEGPDHFWAPCPCCNKAFSEPVKIAEAAE